MRTNRTITSDRVANKDEQWLSRHEADCGQNVKTLPSLAVGKHVMGHLSLYVHSNMI